MTSRPEPDGEKIARLEATVQALQEMVARCTQLAEAAGQQIREIKTGKAPPRRRTKDWSHVKSW